MMITLSPEDIKGFEVSRCYRGKIQALDPQERIGQALLHTHTEFNRLVREVMIRIARVLGDKNNPEFAQLTRWALLNISPAGKCATHFANPFTLEVSRANPTHSAYSKAPDMREMFLMCKKRGDRWYERRGVFGSLMDSVGGSGMIMEVNQAAIEKIKSYLELKALWREGKEAPLALLERDEFVKKAVKFLKECRDYLDSDGTGQFDSLQELLALKIGPLKARLGMLHQYRLQDPDIMDALERAYYLFSQDALGKNNWLAQKRQFEAAHGDFLMQYKDMLQRFRQQVGQERRDREIYCLPRRWERDPNFLQLIDQVGGQGFFGVDFASPMADRDSRNQWDGIRRRGTQLPDFESLSVLLGHRRGRDFFVERLKALNPILFNKNGWFSVLSRYRQFDGKKYQEFRRPPALRYPDPAFRPEWITFSKSGCFRYKHLSVVAPATIELTVKLIHPGTNAWQDYRLRVKLDDRLRTLRSAQVFRIPEGYWKKGLDGQLAFSWNMDDNDQRLYREETLHYWTDSKSGETFPVEIHGGNLIYKPHRGFYLHFRYTYYARYNPKMKTEGSIGGYEPGTRILAFDLGQKSDAIIAIGEYTGDPECPVALVKFVPFIFKRGKRGLGGAVFYQWLRLPGGAGFRAIQHSEKVRQYKRRNLKKRHSDYLRTKQPDGKLSSGQSFTRGQETFKILNTYVRHCRDLHYKQLAGVIFKLAQRNGCKGIVHENLESYRMTVRQERSENRRLQVWAAQKTFDFLKMLCDGGSMNCYAVSAAFSSQTCNQCGSWGVRFNFYKKAKWRRDQEKGYVSPDLGDSPLPLVARGGDWFLCSNDKCCGKKEPGNQNTRYMIQADANAAKNIALRGFRAAHQSALPSVDERKVIADDLQQWLFARYRTDLSV